MCLLEGESVHKRGKKKKEGTGEGKKERVIEKMFL